jgi:NAD(P)-dependent dehydrogenase (short-subunit alcohol dehydrogenase family)
MPTAQKPQKRTPETQKQRPGKRKDMVEKPRTDNEKYLGSGKLKDKVAIITGGDSGIGRAVAIAFVKEGAKLAIVYLNEHEDAHDTRGVIEQYGGECLLIAGDIGDEEFCKTAVRETVDHFGRLDILINNAAEQHPQKSIEDISAEQLRKTFQTNIFSMFYLVKASLPHFKDGSCIINTTSITAYKGNEELIDYSSTKGAIVSFTRSLSQSLVSRGIRVNAVAPGPIWTPLIVSTFEKEHVRNFGTDVPMKRAGEPYELAPAYVFLASQDASYITGQVIHINGGVIVNA